MAQEELAKLNSLPGNVTVWRGYTERNKYGVSWTLSEDVAKFVANRFRRSHHEGMVRKRAVR
jgi:hypothetical protein